MTLADSHAARIKRRGWTEATLRERLKGDAAKVKLAERLRAETLQTVAWVAERLHLGSRAYAKRECHLSVVHAHARKLVLEV